MKKTLNVVGMLILCFAVGAIFNTMIAFASLWYPWITIVTAIVTGYGILTYAIEFITKREQEGDE